VSGVQTTNLAPEFIPLSIKEDKCGGILETVNGSKFSTDLFLNVKTNNNQAIFILFFQPVHDGFKRSAGKSIGRLEFH